MEQNTIETKENMIGIEQKIINWYCDLQEKQAPLDFFKNLKESPFLVLKDIEGGLVDILESALQEFGIEEKIREEIKKKIIANKYNFCKSILQTLEERFKDRG